MMTKIKLSHDQCMTEIDDFVAITADYFKSHSYASGALTVLLSRALGCVDVIDQAQIINDIRMLKAKYEKKGI